MQVVGQVVDEGQSEASRVLIHSGNGREIGVKIRA
jgi:hypothetical protein